MFVFVMMSIVQNMVSISIPKTLRFRVYTAPIHLPLSLPCLHPLPCLGLLKRLSRSSYAAVHAIFCLFACRVTTSNINRSRPVPIVHGCTCMQPCGCGCGHGSACVGACVAACSDAMHHHSPPPMPTPLSATPNYSVPCCRPCTGMDCLLHRARRDHDALQHHISPEQSVGRSRGNGVHTVDAVLHAAVASFWLEAGVDSFNRLCVCGWGGAVVGQLVQMVARSASVERVWGPHSDERAVRTGRTVLPCIAKSHRNGNSVGFANARRLHCARKHFRKQHPPCCEPARGHRWVALRPPVEGGRSPANSRCGGLLLLSVSADVRASGDVTAFEGI